MRRPFLVWTHETRTRDGDRFWAYWTAPAPENETFYCRPLAAPIAVSNPIPKDTP